MLVPQRRLERHNGPRGVVKGDSRFYSQFMSYLSSPYSCCAFRSNPICASTISRFPSIIMQRIFCACFGTIFFAEQRLVFTWRSDDGPFLCRKKTRWGEHHDPGMFFLLKTQNTRSDY
jgi:hypothetical protein